MIQNLAEEIAPFLVVVCQKSLDSGQVPVDWKVANVCPIFKNGDKADPGNYRPVSLTSVFCKVLEHIIFSTVADFL